jgi:hypothetical protein
MNIRTDVGSDEIYRFEVKLKLRITPSTELIISPLQLKGAGRGDYTIYVYCWKIYKNM